jgi:Importin-beta N-terminal domain
MKSYGGSCTYFRCLDQLLLSTRRWTGVTSISSSSSISSSISSSSSSLGVLLLAIRLGESIHTTPANGTALPALGTMAAAGGGEDAVATLRGLLAQTLSPDATVRKGAEAYVSNMERQPAYPQLLIRLIETHCSGTSADDTTLRTLGAIMFKNLVKRCWAPPEDGEAKALSTSDKDAIKGNMVHMMCIVPPEVQRQFSEALAIISKHDFPKAWGSLLPDLVQKMATDDFGVVHSVLLTANSILKRFRCASMHACAKQPLFVCWRVTRGQGLLACIAHARW